MELHYYLLKEMEEVILSNYRYPSDQSSFQGSGGLRFSSSEELKEEIQSLALRL